MHIVNRGQGFRYFWPNQGYVRNRSKSSKSLWSEYLGKLSRQSLFGKSFDIDDKDGDCVLVMKSGFWRKLAARKKADNQSIVIGEFPSRTWLKDNKQKFQIMTPQGLEVGQAELNSDNTTLSFPQAWLTKNFQLIRDNLSSLIFRNGRADKSRVTWVYFCLVNKRNLCLILICCLLFQPIVCEIIEILR